MLKIVGICLLLFALIGFIGRLSTAEKKRREISCELYELFRHIRRQVSCYLMPVCEIVESYSSANLEKCGFLEKMRHGDDPMCALTGKYKISEHMNNAVAKMLASLGEGYVDDELRLLDSSLAEIKSLLDSEYEEGKKRIKLYSVLSSSVGVGLLILVL